MNRHKLRSPTLAVASAVVVVLVGLVAVAANIGPLAHYAGPAGFGLTSADSTGADSISTKVNSADSANESAVERDSLSTVAVRRGDLSAEREFRAAVSFGEPWLVNTAATGTITYQRPVGEIVDAGDPLLRIDDRPLFLANGEMPMYRELHEVNTRTRDRDGNRLKLLTGLDVKQLQLFLVEAGFDAGGRLEVDGEFGGDTETAVEAWQEAVGLPVTGSIDNSQIVFSPHSVRIATESRVGAAFSGLEVNNADSSVLVDTTNRDRRPLGLGTDVDIELPGGEDVAGTVTEQEQVTSADGSLVWRTTIVAKSQLPGDAATATVTVTEVVAQDVLLVPTGALLALAEGGFAVEVIAGPVTELVAVQVGEVLDGQAEIAGDIAVGDKVVIPT